MAKKKNQNIVITDKELTPTIIGKLDTKQKSPVILIFIFIIFIAVAFFLPDITNYIESYLKGTNIYSPVNPNNGNNTDIDQEETPNESEEIVYYDYTTDLAINYDSFTMSNIFVAENEIYFDLKNNTSETLRLQDNKYFLEIYTSDTILIQRIKISYGVIEANSQKSYSYDLDENISSNLSKLLITNKSENDYPEVTLTADAEGNGLLTCIKDYETITYTFINDNLVNINDIVNYPVTDSPEYTTELQKYQVMATTYNNLEGISSTLITVDTGFTFTTLIDLRNADITNLENNNYYNYRTLAKTVKFETESNGFSCN